MFFASDSTSSTKHFPARQSCRPSNPSAGAIPGARVHTPPCDWNSCPANRVVISRARLVFFFIRRDSQNHVRDFYNPGHGPNHQHDQRANPLQ